MTSNNRGTDVIGKLFVVRSHGLRECLVCGELFSQTTGLAHAVVNCYQSVEFCLLARCVAVIVASPALFQVQCKTPRQIELANAFCRYLEMARQF